MKELLLLLSVVLLLTVGCKQMSPSPQVASDERQIVIAVSDDGMQGYKIEGPIPADCIIPAGNRPHWTIVNNTEKGAIASVVIGPFAQVIEDPSKKKLGICKDGTSSFTYSDSIGHGTDKSYTTSCYANDPASDREVYKYTVTIRMSGGTNPKPVDPYIVIIR